MHVAGTPDLVGQLRDGRRRAAPGRTRCGRAGRVCRQPRLPLRRSSSSPARPRPARRGSRCALAERLGDVEIISADSRQVYRGMDIGTAKVAPAERAPVPHHGLDLVDPDEPFTAADFQRHALDALAGHRRAWPGGAPGRRHRALPARRGPGRAARRTPVRPRAAGRAWRRGLDVAGLAALAAELRDASPRRSRPARTWPTRAASCGRSNGRRSSATGCPRSRRGYPAPVTWLGLSVEHAAHRVWIAEPCRGAVRKRACCARRRRSRARYDPRSRRFSAIGYREAIEVAGAVAPRPRRSSGPSCGRAPTRGASERGSAPSPESSGSTRCTIRSRGPGPGPPVPGRRSRRLRSGGRLGVRGFPHVESGAEGDRGHGSPEPRSGLRYSSADTVR